MDNVVNQFATFELRTDRGSGFINITPQVSEIITSAKVNEGICTVYIPHTTAGVTINEAADPSVRRDMTMELDRIVPFDDGYTHAEGNSAAHIKTTLTGPSVTIPIHQSRLTLGTWQGIYFCEFDGPRRRNVHIQILGSM